MASLKVAVLPENRISELREAFARNDGLSFRGMLPVIIRQRINETAKVLLTPVKNYFLASAGE